MAKKHRKTVAARAARKSARKPMGTPARKSAKTPAGKAARPKARPAAKTAAAPQRPGPRDQFIGMFTKEHPTTLKVMKAFPADQGHYQPHPRSQSAKTLMWTFVIEQKILLDALSGKLAMPPSFPPEPETIEEVIAAYEQSTRELTRALARLPEAKLFGTAPFFTGPGQMGQVPVIDLMWLMLMDSIHHRGQLSTYIRPAGGKVPSIYGPSGDEPWM